MTIEEIRERKINYFQGYCDLKGWIKGKLTWEQFVEMRNEYINKIVLKK